MRLPNGTGTISKLSGKRRKPYCAKKFVRWDVDDTKMTCKAVYKSIGTFATKREALHALLEYTDRSGMMTLEEIYNIWEKEHFPEISESLQSSYSNAWRRYAPLKKKYICDLKTSDYEKIINEDTVPPSIRRFCKLVLGIIYDYALRHELVDKDYSKLVDFHIDNKRKHDKVIFSVDEINGLWEKNKNGTITQVEKMILVQCYTGMRPGELVQIRKENVHLDEHYMTGGLKTAAGKNRVIPIHPLIEPFIREAYEEKKPGYLFNNGLDPFDYKSYAYLFKKTFPNHTGHEARHTFITYCDGKLTVAAIDTIVGHSSGRIAEAVYTHLTPAMLYEQIKLFSIP